MSVNNAELLQTPESLSEQGWNRFHEAWRIPEAYREEYREYFEGVVDKVKAECLDPALAELLDVGADYYRWFLFADRGDALPDTLAIRKLLSYNEDDIPEYAVSVHPDHRAAAYGYSGVIDGFTSYAAKDLESLFDGAESVSTGSGSTVPETDGSRRADRVQDRYEALVDVITSTPTYGLLQSFNHDPTSHGDRPLTPLERQTRQAHITQQVREKHGLQEGDPIHFRSQPDLDIRKLTAQLDDEKIRGRRPGEETTPAERARDYFVAKTLEIYKQEGVETPRVEYDAIGRPTFVFSSHRERLYIGNPIVNQVAHSIVAELGSENAVNSKLARQVLYDVIARIRTDRNLDEVLKEAVSHAAQQQLHHLSFDMLHSYMQQTDGYHKIHYNLIVAPDWVRALHPQGPIFDTSVYRENSNIPTMIMRHRPFATKPQIVERARIQELSQRTVATVTRAPEAIHDITPRLVVMGSAAPPMPLPSSRFDLEISFPHQRTDNVLIPGYQLSGVDTEQGIFQFLKSDVDPYMLPEIPISDDGKGRLMKYYEDHRYDALSDALREADPVSVVDLVRIISNNSDYTYDTQLPEKEVVGVQGRPQVQCTGAAHLLEASLQHALSAEFSSLRASVVLLEGHVLKPGSSKINGLKHQQVQLTFEGASYLLDATPSGDMATESVGRAVASRAGRQQRFLQRFKRGGGLSRPSVTFKQPTIENIQEISVPEPVTLPKTQPLYESVAAQKVAERKDPGILRGRLEQQLMAAFHAPNADALMKRLLHEPQEDPVRRTISLAIQSTSDQGISTDIEALRQYVAQYERLTPVQRKQYRLSTYGPEMIRILTDYIDELST